MAQIPKPEFDMYSFYPYLTNLVQVRAQDNWYMQPPCDPIQPSPQPETAEVPGSHNPEDTFGLEFAAVQWLNLVANAENLFNKLLNANELSCDEKDQIQRWLCLKQECEEVVATNEGGRNRNSLDRIDELTESGANTGDSLSFEKSSDSQYESETESDFDCQHPDFGDKLDGYMERFKDKTDELVRRKLEINECDVEEESDQLITGSYSQGRRRSLHPGSILILPSFARDQSEPQRPGTSSYRTTSPDSDAYRELKALSTGNDLKKNQIKQVSMDLEGARKRIEELQHTIDIKERFIKEMIKNSETRNNAKHRFQRKWTKLEEEYYKTRTQLAHAESALHQTKQSKALENLSVHKSQVEKYRSLARYFEKRLKDIECMKQIAGDSTKKVLELENSLQYSKKQMDKFKKQLKVEETHKEKLEKELHEDEKKMKELQEKYNLQSASKEKEDDGGRLKWIEEETERLNLMRESSQRLHQQLVQQGMLDKRETPFSIENQRNNMTARISELENKLKTNARDGEEQLRQEIHNLRKTRDHLLEQRSNLDEKYRKSRGLSPTEERTYLECAEAIEAIDAAIEYKNELICGRKALGSETDCERAQGEQLLMERLLKLSTDELRTLLYKYFQKVIDLRENGRWMEEQLVEAERHNDEQIWKVHLLNQDLEAQKLEYERRIVLLQREYQEKVHLMLRNFAEESGSSGTEAGRHLVISKESEASKLKRENKVLRRRLQEMEAMMHATAAAGRVMRLRSRSASPDHRPQKSITAPTPATKVTREKNKVIISLNTQKKESGASKKRDVLYHYHK